MASTPDINTSEILSEEDVIEETIHHSKDFSNCSLVYEGSTSRLVKAKRQNRWWILKTVIVPSAGGMSAELLRKEYAILSQLQHPNIVQTIGTEEVSPYGQCIVMEYIDGVTLDVFMKDNPSRSVRLLLLQQLLDGVEYIHSLQIVHRDLKPQNIIVTRNGKNLKIIDFGLADMDAHTALKHPAGTRSYMSLEQMHTSVPDVRNDIYSIGCIMQEMHLGWQYQAIVRKCQKDITHRYRNIHELRSAVQRVQRLPYILLVAILVLFLAVALSLVAFQQKDNSNDMQEMNKVQTELLRRTQDKFLRQHTADSMRIQAMTDSIRAGKLREQKRLMHEQQNRDAYIKGCALIDKEIQSFKITSCKDATLLMRFENELIGKIDRYVLSCKNLLSEEERSALNLQLKNDLTQKLEPVIQQWQQKIQFTNN